MNQQIVKAGNVAFGGNLPISFILGPCQLENYDHAMMMVSRISDACLVTGSKFVFKGSYDKANRTSGTSSRGIGMYEGLRVLEDVRTAFGCPVTTDVHEVSSIAAVADVVDLIQIPAFLSRQTDLLLAAGRTGLAVNVKKGQFLSPCEMTNVADKIVSTGNNNVMLCERGTSFGYNTLVNDFRGLVTMAETGFPVIFDATHSVQKPAGLGTSSGGDRRFVASLAKAACAVGVAGVFIETHQDPDNAPCDGPNMININDLAGLIRSLRGFDALAKSEANICT